MVADVVNNKGKHLASWKVIKKARVDPTMAEENAKHFVETGVRGINFESESFTFEDLFFHL